MFFKLYRIVHILWTGIFTLLISIPIFENGQINRSIIDDSFFIVIWLLGVILVFTKRFIKYGFVLTLVPVLFILTLFVF